MTIFKLSDIQPNPFRQVERYPLRPEKIAALIGSIDRTGFWDNVLARIGPQGRPELAYGHHRLAALREFYKEDPEYEVDLIVREISDEDMLIIMADENMEEYRTDFRVAMETVNAVVKAYGEGKITLLKPAQKVAGSSRFAPSFIVGTPISGDRRAPYTVDTVRVFLRWKDEEENRVRFALRALEYVERRYIDEPDFVDLKQLESRLLIEQIPETRRQQEESAKLDDALGAHAIAEGGKGAEDFAASAAVRAAAERGTELTRRIMHSLADGLRSGDISTGTLAEEAQKLRNEMISSVARRLRQQSTSLTVWANQLCTSLTKFLSDDKTIKQLNQLLVDDGEGQAFVAHLDPHVIAKITQAMEDIPARVATQLGRFVEACAAQPQPQPASPTLRLTRPTSSVVTLDSRRTVS